MRNRPMLTHDDVRKMIAACEAEARKNGWNVTIAIVDDAGYALQLIRMDGAGPLTADIAQMKAKTAAISRAPTRFWEDRIKERPAFLKVPNNFPVTGGVPIKVGQDCVGAIGVSGVQSHEDEQIALAGAAALQA